MFSPRLSLLLGGLLLFAASFQSAQKPAPLGPDSEKRFPPLVLPEGFQASLFACDPLIEYPSAIALGPRPGSLFVAVDYLTGLGTGIERRDEVRLIEDTDEDGYADTAPVFATGFNSIQGMAYHQGTLYVMHAPYLTALRDPDRVGKAEERRDLLVGLGLSPEKDPIRLHNANGVVAGHDGWLYLALGDHGCDVKRPEGDRLILEGGGILRCRPDGRDLHVFSTGLRNIYDIALDDELNAFVRDNENDGGDYKIRVCHSFFGADHGYPYLYHERPDEALPPLADLGLGSSAGGVCYRERQFPAEYRGSLFFCEWGRAVVRYPLKRAGASFASPREIDFAAGAANDPYGFKPTDLVVDHDGALFIADWADGQRPRRGRGRIYRVTYPRPSVKESIATGFHSDSYFRRRLAQETVEERGKEGAAWLVEALDSKLLDVRGRLHAVWGLAKANDTTVTERLFKLATSDVDPRVQAQAVRALGDLHDPVIVRHRLDAGPGDATIAERLAKLGAGREPIVQLEVVIALGRLRWPGTAAWLRANLQRPDAALAHAAQWAMRRAGDWPAVLKILDEPGSEPFRAIARRAIADQYDPGLVDALRKRLRTEPDATHRREYADLLTRVYKKSAAWSYWGFRPPPRPAHTVAWERSEAIEQALDHALADSERAVRHDILRRMLREKVPATTATLGRWLNDERATDTVNTILGALRDRPGGEARPYVEGVLRDTKHATANRLRAAALFIDGLDSGSDDKLLSLAEALEDGPVLAELLRAAGARKQQTAASFLVKKLASTDAVVRAAAVTALAELDVPEAHEPIRQLLNDSQPRVRSAAAMAAGKLALRPAADQLLKLSKDLDNEVRRSSLEALQRLREPRALPLALEALRDPETAVLAIACVGALGGPEHASIVADLARRQPSAEILAATGKVLSGWLSKPGLRAEQRTRVEEAFAEIHGGSGVLLGWHVFGPIAGDAADVVDKLHAGPPLPTEGNPRLILSIGTDARVKLNSKEKLDGVWLAYAELLVGEPTQAEFLMNTSAAATFWLNGRIVSQSNEPTPTGPASRFNAALVFGLNRILVRLAAGQGTGEFQLRFRRKSATAEHERLTLAALARAGNPERGRQLFANAEKSLCLKCHRLGDQGERVGPELTGLGSRFSKAYIIESLLEPSRTISPSFESTLLELKDGKVLSGVKTAETETSITLVDSEARKHTIARAGIEQQKKQATSAMPDGIEKRLTEDEFVDLVSFLASLKESRSR